MWCQGWFRTLKFRNLKCENYGGGSNYKQTWVRLSTPTPPPRDMHWAIVKHRVRSHSCGRWPCCACVTLLSEYYNDPKIWWCRTLKFRNLKCENYGGGSNYKQTWVRLSTPTPPSPRDMHWAIVKHRVRSHSCGRWPCCACVTLLSEYYNDPKITWTRISSVWLFYKKINRFCSQ